MRPPPATAFVFCSIISAPSAIRGHWGIESLHWVLDVIFGEDLSRLRTGHGARNMALVRRFAFNLVRLGRGKRSIKTMRKVASWSTEALAALLTTNTREPGLDAVRITAAY